MSVRPSAIMILNQGGCGHLTVNYTDTQSFTTMLSYSLNQKLLVLLLNFNGLIPNWQCSMCSRNLSTGGVILFSIIGDATNLFVYHNSINLEFWENFHQFWLLTWNSFIGQFVYSVGRDVWGKEMEGLYQHFNLLLVSLYQKT